MTRKGNPATISATSPSSAVNRSAITPLTACDHCTPRRRNSQMRTTSPKADDGNTWLNHRLIIRMRIPASHSIDTSSERMISIQRPFEDGGLNGDQCECQQEHRRDRPRTGWSATGRGRAGAPDRPARRSRARASPQKMSPSWRATASDTNSLTTPDIRRGQIMRSITAIIQN